MEFPKRVGIVGAGIAGASVAYVAARAGASVTVFDPAPEQGASHVPRAMVHPFGGRRAAASRRRVEAFHMTLEWAAELQPEAKTGILRVATDEEKAELWQGVADKWAEVGGWIDADKLQARLPSVADGMPGGIEVPDGMSIEPKGFIGALLDHENISAVPEIVNAIGEDEEGAWIEGDERHRFDVVVLAGGAYSQPMTAHPIGLEPMSGSAIIVRGPGPDEPVAGHGQLTPIGNGETVVAGTYRKDRNAELTNQDVTSLIDKAAATLPDMASCELVRGWTAVRAASKDRKPVVGAIGDRVYVLVGLGSKGFLLGPWAATQLVATWRGKDSLPEEWSPQRYLPGAQAPKKRRRRDKNQRPPSGV